MFLALKLALKIYRISSSDYCYLTVFSLSLRFRHEKVISLTGFSLEVWRSANDNDADVGGTDVY